MSKNRDKKVQLVSQVEAKIAKAKAIVLTDYRGLTHKQLEDLRKALKKVDAELSVIKNTLLHRAISTQTNTKDIAKDMPVSQGPTATLFAYSDPIGPLKELSKMIKLLKIPTIKMGFFAGKIITADEVIKLATLPSREVLLAQLAFGMKSPIYSLHRALNWNIQKLVLTLKSIESKRAAG